MHKIKKGIKKKIKGKKDKNKDELFTPEELEKYRREQQQKQLDQLDGEPSEAENSEEWQKFKQLTAGVDVVLHKTQEELERQKASSYLTEKKKEAQKQQQKQQEKLVDPACEEDHKDSPKNKWVTNWDKTDEEEEEEQAAAEGKEEATAEETAEEPEQEVPEPEDNVVDDDELFDTGYLDLIESGEIKLAQIPDSPVEELGDDPFDTSIADKLVLEEKKDKRPVVDLGSAANVLSKQPIKRRRVIPVQDTTPQVIDLLGGFDDEPSTGFEESKKEGLEPFQVDAEEEKSEETTLKDILDDFDCITGNTDAKLTSNLELLVEKTTEAVDDDDDDDEFAKLASVSVAKSKVDSILAEVDTENDPFDTSNISELLEEKPKLSHPSESIDDAFDDLAASSVAKSHSVGAEKLEVTLEEPEKDPFDTSTLEIVLDRQDPFNTSGVQINLHCEDLLENSDPESAVCIDKKTLNSEADSSCASEISTDEGVEVGGESDCAPDKSERVSPQEPDLKDLDPVLNPEAFQPNSAALVHAVVAAAAPPEPDPFDTSEAANVLATESAALEAIELVIPPTTPDLLDTTVVDDPFDTSVAKKILKESDSEEELEKVTCEVVSEPVRPQTPTALFDPLKNSSTVEEQVVPGTKVLEKLGIKENKTQVVPASDPKQNWENFGEIKSSEKSEETKVEDQNSEEVKDTELENSNSRRGSETVSTSRRGSESFPDSSAYIARRKPRKSIPCNSIVLPQDSAFFNEPFTGNQNEVSSELQKPVSILQPEEDLFDLDKDPFDTSTACTVLGIESQKEIQEDVKPEVPEPPKEFKRRGSLHPEIQDLDPLFSPDTPEALAAVNTISSSQVQVAVAANSAVASDPFDTSAFSQITNQVASLTSGLDNPSQNSSSLTSDPFVNNINQAASVQVNGASGSYTGLVNETVAVDGMCVDLNSTSALVTDIDDPFDTTAVELVLNSNVK